MGSMAQTVQDVSGGAQVLRTLEELDVQIHPHLHPPADRNLRSDLFPRPESVAALAPAIPNGQPIGPRRPCTTASLADSSSMGTTTQAHARRPRGGYAFFHHHHQI